MKFIQTKQQKKVQRKENLYNGMLYLETIHWTWVQHSNILDHCKINNYIIASLVKRYEISMERYLIGTSQYYGTINNNSKSVQSLQVFIIRLVGKEMWYIGSEDTWTFIHYIYTKIARLNEKHFGNTLKG
jgi:hypothetical protein